MMLPTTRAGGVPRWSVPCGCQGDLAWARGRRCVGSPGRKEPRPPGGGLRRAAACRVTGSSGGGWASLERSGLLWAPSCIWVQEGTPAGAWTRSWGTRLYTEGSKPKGSQTLQFIRTTWRLGQTPMPGPPLELSITWSWDRAWEFAFLMCFQVLLMVLACQRVCCVCLYSYSPLHWEFQRQKEEKSFLMCSLENRTLKKSKWPQLDFPHKYTLSFIVNS